MNVKCHPRRPLTPFYLVYGQHAVMPTDVALAPLLSVSRDQLTYAKELVFRLAKAREIFSVVTEELKHKRKEYYDLSRKFQSFKVRDYVLVKRPPRLNKGNNELALKWLPKWDGPYQITEQVKDSDNSKLQHAYTGKRLDHTNVNKLIHVEPWALDSQQHIQDNHSADQDIQTPEPDQNITRIPTAEPQYSVGDFVVFEQPGSDNLIDDDFRNMITDLFNWLVALPNQQAETSEACKYLYSCNQDYKELLTSLGRIRRVLYYTASIELVVEQATGGKNFVRTVGTDRTPLFNLDRLGGKYAIGQISFIPNDDDEYEILIYDRKSKNSSWDKPLKPVILEGQEQVRIVSPNFIKCKILLENNKLTRESIETLDRLQLLLVYSSFTV